MIYHSQISSPCLPHLFFVVPSVDAIDHAGNINENRTIDQPVDEGGPVRGRHFAPNDHQMRNVGNHQRRNGSQSILKLRKVYIEDPISNPAKKPDGHTYGQDGNNRISIDWKQEMSSSEWGNFLLLFFFIVFDHACDMFFLQIGNFIDLRTEFFNGTHYFVIHFGIEDLFNSFLKLVNLVCFLAGDLDVLVVIV